MKKYITLPSLTIGRGFAALMVGTHHAYQAFGAFAFVGGIGWIGVSYFYILSGFVLTWSFAPGRPLSEFYLHRLARIYPLHIVGLIVSVLFYIALKSPVGGNVGTAWDTVANVLLIHDWIPNNSVGRFSWNGVSWSLSCEMFFYVFAPYLITSLSRLSSRRLFDIAACLYFLHMTLGVVSFYNKIHWLQDFLQFHPVARIPEFIYGIVFAIFVQRGVHMRVSTLVNFLMFLPLLFYYRYCHEGLYGAFMVDLGAPAFVAAIVSGAVNDLRPTTPGKIKQSFIKIGESSYSFYMTHTLILGGVGYLYSLYNVQISPASKAIIFLMSSLVLSLFIFRYIELPGRRMVTAIGRRFINTHE